MTDRPRIVGLPPRAAAYRDAVAKRAEAARVARPKLPNIAQADAQYKPGKDKAMTLAQMGEAQRNIEHPEQREPGLSKETVAGLQALHKAMEEQKAKATLQEHVQNPVKIGAQPPLPRREDTKMEAAAEPVKESKDEKAEEKPPVSDKEKSAIRDRLNEMDDLEFDRLMRGIQTDVVNNEKERDAVAKRVKPIDITDGISTGEFIQDVPIVPDKLTVRFRSLSAMENQAIRLLLFKLVDEDPRREGISAELYSLMQVVASVVRINGNEMPSHVKGSGIHDQEFDEDAFTRKFKLMARYPMALLHALGTHGFWFDQRVRAAFSTENLKNG